MHYRNLNPEFADDALAKHTVGAILNAGIFIDIFLNLG